MISKLDWTIINKYIDDDLIIIKKHNKLDLWILNYSKTCQFERRWDEVLLQCRGLVIDGSGNIVARPFTKFFNYEEHTSTDLPDVPTNLTFDAFEKEDGSLGIVFYYLGNWYVITKGSFISDQSIKARGILHDKFGGDLSFLNKDSTYLFEIIYPENMIVVNYKNKTDLILLGVIDTNTGRELSYSNMSTLYSRYFSIVKKYDGITDFDKIRDCNQDNREGFIVRFSNGFRVKIKFEEYCRIHAIVTNVSNKSIWESLMNNDSLEELLNNVPDEFYEWVVDVRDGLLESYDNLLKEVNLEYKSIINGLDMDYMIKDFALIAKESKNSGILFKIERESNIEKDIWNRIRPVYSKPFSNEI